MAAAANNHDPAGQVIDTDEPQPLVCSTPPGEISVRGQPVPPVLDLAQSFTQFLPRLAISCEELSSGTLQLDQCPVHSPTVETSIQEIRHIASTQAHLRHHPSAVRS